MAGLRLEALEGDYAVCRLDPGADVPAPDTQAFWTVTHTEEETSVVCAADDAPPDAKVEGPFALMRVTGTLSFSLTGVLSGITTALAGAGVSVFAISTYDTDYFLVPRDMLGPATEALRGAGYDL